MGESMVSVVAFDVQDVIRKVIVLVNNKIKRAAGGMRGYIDIIEFLLPMLQPSHLLNETIGIESRIFPRETVAAHAKIEIEILLQTLHITAHQGEVQMHNLVLVPILRRMVGNVQSTEQLLKTVLLINIVISLKHIEEKTLAETARTDKKQEVACLLHLLEIHGLVDQVFVLTPHLLEIGDAVRY